MSSSKRWLDRQRNDPYVKKAHKLGLRSRAAFKLQEIQNKHHFIKSKNNVVDLGAAPGSWSEIAKDWLNEGQIVACDLLMMDPIEKVEFVQGDFTSPDIQAKLLNLCENNIDTILSDMSPNKTGVKKVDQWKSTALCETVLHFAESHLKVNGNLLFKCFHGDGFEEVLKMARSIFKSVKSIKPDASRKNSTEIYLLCLAKKDKA